MGLWAEIRECNACPLRSSMICQPIPGFTTIKNPDVMIIGEAPGSDECLIEKPFQGMAGKLLNKMLLKAGIDRNRLYITNIVKCRPTIGKKNRPPKPAEILSCYSWILEEIKLIKPKLIITMGLLSTKQVANDKGRMEDICGKTIKRSIVYKNELINIDIVPLYHTSALLQNSRDKLDFCQDVLTRLRKEYEFCKW